MVGGSRRGFENICVLQGNKTQNASCLCSKGRSWTDKETNPNNCPHGMPSTFPDGVLAFALHIASEHCLQD